MHHDLGVRACWVFIIIVSAACKDLKSLLVLNVSCYSVEVMFNARRSVSAACKDLKSLLVLNVSCYSVEVMFNARRSEKNLLRQPTAIASSSPGANGRMSQTTRCAPHHQSSHFVAVLAVLKLHECASFLSFRMHSRVSYYLCEIREYQRVEKLY